MEGGDRAAGAMRDKAGVIRQGDHVEGIEVEQCEKRHAGRRDKAAGGAGREGTQAGDAEGHFGGADGVEVAA